MRNPTKRTKPSYDHRIKLEIIRSGNPNLFPELNIPPSTAKNWIRRGPSETVTLESFDLEKSDLIIQLQEALLENKKLNALFTMVQATMKVLGLNLKNGKVPEAKRKSAILELVKTASQSLPLEECLSVIELSSQRYKSWLKREKSCDLADHPTCPKSTPSKIIPPEISIIRKYVEDDNFSHFSLSSLWLYVKYHQKELCLSLSSWFRIIHQEKLRRTSRKKYYVKPKHGVRASKPNQIWHIDISVFRIKETKYYIQAIRDNFSRLILAYSVSDTYGGASTKKLIEEALDFAGGSFPDLFVDKGPENLNENVDDLVKSNLITRIIAQLDVVFSNSLIESFFNQLKNRYLYYVDINSFEKLKKCVAFYVKEQNEVMPMMVLNGSTPAIVYKLGHLPEKDELAEKSMVKGAIRRRIEYRSSLNCRAC